jgi:hypothetical protein
MVRSTLAAALALALAPALLACGSKPEPVTPSLSDPAGAASGPMPEAAAAPAPETASDPARRPRKPFPIHSSCAEVVTLAFGEDPKAEAAGKRALAPSSTIEGPRDAEGKQTVWLLDDKGEPLVKVNITRGMKTLEIGRSCRTLDAR